MNLSFTKTRAILYLTKASTVMPNIEFSQSARVTPDDAASAPEKAV